MSLTLRAFVLSVLISSITAAAENETLTELQHRAEHGDVKAQTELCAKYTVTGESEPPDVTAAVKWCRRAADQGYADGQFGLGVMIFLGQGVTQDNAEAVKWYRRAAEQGHARAQATLGAMYIGGGGGVPQDYNEALKWVRRAAEQDDRMGQLSLGVMYANGWGVRLHKAEAERWFLKGLEDHDAEDQGLAQLNIGDMYAEGRNVPQSDAEAAKWHRMAAEQGHDGAQNALKAELVEKGLELSPSDRRLIQMGLVAEGFEPGLADGLFGPRTRKAIERWQTSRQEASTGYLDTQSAKVLLASGREREVRENAQRQPTTAERRGREKQAAKEVWRCFAMRDYNKTAALFTLTRVRRSSEDFGEVSVAGTTHLASFEVAGLNRRWDFGYDEIRDRYLYAFIVTPDGTGLYYDFSISSDGKASPRDHFKCRMSP